MRRRKKIDQNSRVKLRMKYSKAIKKRNKKMPQIRKASAIY